MGQVTMMTNSRCAGVAVIRTAKQRPQKPECRQPWPPDCPYRGSRPANRWPASAKLFAIAQFDRRPMSPRPGRHHAEGVSNWIPLDVQARTTAAIISRLIRSTVDNAGPTKVQFDSRRVLNSMVTFRHPVHRYRIFTTRQKLCFPVRQRNRFGSPICGRRLCFQALPEEMPTSTAPAPKPRSMHRYSIGLQTEMLPGQTTCLRQPGCQVGCYRRHTQIVAGRRCPFKASEALAGILDTLRCHFAKRTLSITLLTRHHANIRFDTRFGRIPFWPDPRLVCKRELETVPTARCHHSQLRDLDFFPGRILPKPFLELADIGGTRTSMLVINCPLASAMVRVRVPGDLPRT